MNKSYEQLVAQAEAAVSKVKDGELRRVAFEKILDDLLSAEHKSPNSVDTKRKANAPEKKKTGPRRSTTKRRGGPQTYVGELATEGFFKKPKTLSQVKAELENRGHHIPLTSLSGPLQKLCQRRTLRRNRTNGDGRKQTFAYSDW